MQILLVNLCKTKKNNLENQAYDVALNAKLHVLSFFNHLIGDLYTYTRHLIITNKSDNEEITKCVNTYSKPIADERHNLGIIVDNGGNYIDPKNTNKLGF